MDSAAYAGAEFVELVDVRRAASAAYIMALTMRCL